MRLSLAKKLNLIMVQIRRLKGLWITWFPNSSRHRIESVITDEYGGFENVLAKLDASLSSLKKPGGLTQENIDIYNGHIPYFMAMMNTPAFHTADCVDGDAFVSKHKAAILALIRDHGVFLRKESIGSSAPWGDVLVRLTGTAVISLSK